MPIAASNRGSRGVCARLLALSCALLFGACASSAREPRVMMPTQPQSYIRTYPPDQQGNIPSPASKRYTQPAAPRASAGARYPQSASMNVETSTPQRPVIYPQDAEGPGLRMIQHRAPSIPAWAQQQETMPVMATGNSALRTPDPNVDPEYAPRQPLNAAPARPTAPAYVPPARQPQPQPQQTDAVRQTPPSPSPTETFVPPSQRFDARTSSSGSRYDIQSGTSTQPSRAHWWLGESEPAATKPSVTIPSPAPAPAPAPVSKPVIPAAPAYTPPATPSYTPPSYTAPSYAPPAPSTSSAPSSGVYPAPGTQTPLPAMDPTPRTTGSVVAGTYAGGASRGIILGAGDVVTINVLGRPELTATVDVTGAGAINVPLAGDVPVAGLSTSEAAARVEDALRRGEFVINPQVTLTTTETRSQQVSVLGEVNQPGRFKIETRTTVMDGLAQAGGISATGMNFAYILRREGGVVARYEMDIDALIEAGVGQQYFELQPGDTVIVPKAELFYIYGEVRAPNSYRLKPGMGVIQALSLAGGLTDKGSDRRIEIRRRGADGGLHTFAVNLSDPIYPEDVIYVKERFF